MHDRTLITGATGQIGSRLLDRLDPSPTLRVMCRREAQRAELSRRGFDVAVADWRDPDSLDTALGDCRTLFLVAPPVRAQEQLGLAAIAAAGRAGVEHVVLVSTSDARADSPMPWARAMATIEARLRESGMTWTMLRPTGFMSLVTQPAGAIRRGLLPQTSGHGRVALIDPGDIAACAEVVLRDPDLHRDASYDLSGPEALSFADVATIMSAVGPRRVRFVQVPAPLMWIAFRLGGAERWQADGLVAQFARINRHERDGVATVTDVVQRLTGREPVDLATFLQSD